MKIRFVSVLCLCALCLLLTQTPTIRAGSLNIAPSTVYGTVILFSASYPDFRFSDSPTKISISISVTFNNASISAVNITAIYVRLYYSDVNLTQVPYSGYPPPSYSMYAEGSWLSTDDREGGSLPPQKMQRPSPEVTSATWSVEPLTLHYWTPSEQTQEVQAKLYIVVTLCFLDTNGQPILHSTKLFSLDVLDYHWWIDTGEGEAPYVTIFPRVEQQSGLPISQVFAVVIVLVGAILVVVALVIVTRRRRMKTKEPTEGPHESPPPPSTSQS